MNRTFAALTLAVTLAACGGGGNGDAKAQKPADAGKPATEEQATSVRAVRVGSQTVQPWIYGQGTARAVRREFLTFPSAGRIAWVDPKLKVGDKVKKGQLIAYQQPDRAQAELANARAGVSGTRTDLAVARASQREALANLELARATFERFRILLERKSASRQEYDEAEAKLASAQASAAKAEAQIEAIQAQTRASAAQLGQAEVTVSESRIVSPINGVLARLNIEQGYHFSPQTVQSTSEQGALSTIPVFIIDPSAYEVSVDLPAHAIGRLAVDAQVIMSPREYTERDAARGSESAAANAPPPSGSGVEGKVYSITPSIDPEKRTFQVKARTAKGKSQSLLRDGEFVSIWIAAQAGAAAPVVPFDALRYKEGKPFVFVVDRDSGKVARRAVELGAQGRETQAVSSGVKPGEWVVTEGRAGLSDGDRVRVLEPARSASEPR